MTEGRIYAAHILASRPDAKVAVLYQNDEFGKDIVRGFLDGLGDKAKIDGRGPGQLRGQRPTVDSQIISLRSSGADTLMNFSQTKFAAQTIRKMAAIGWKPAHYLTNVSNSVAAVLKPAGAEHAKGLLSATYLRDPSDARDTPERARLRGLHEAVLPEGDPNDTLNVTGYSMAQALVQLLTQAGDDLTRANLMKQAASLDMTLPMLYPGIRLKTGPDNFYPIRQMQLVRFDGTGREIRRPARAVNTPSTGAPLLRVQAVTVRFGGIVALDAVSFSVEAGQICGLIGPNGAGKSTVFNCLSRIYDCGAGSIEFDGRRISTLPRHRMAGEGIGRTFQNLALFRSMSVRENLLVGCHGRQPAGFLRRPAAPARRATHGARGAGEGDELLRFLALEDCAERIVADLPFGTQKRVELGRALCGRPRLLLLDEPACGLNHEELEGLAALIREIRDRLGVTVLLVEHHMGLVMAISDQVVALELRPQDRRGHAGRGAAAPRGDPAPIWEAAACAMLLEVEGLHAAYGPTRVLHGIDLSMRGRLGHRPARRQRRRQDPPPCARCARWRCARTGTIRIGGERADGRRHRADRAARASPTCPTAAAPSSR